MSKTTISDSRIRVNLSENFISFIKDHSEHIVEIPSNLSVVLRENGCALPAKVEILETEVFKHPKIDLKLLADINEQPRKTRLEDDEMKTAKQLDSTQAKSDAKHTTGTGLTLTDLQWLNLFLAGLRKNDKTKIYLHQLLEGCQIKLPENEIIERNPELEARCEKLRQQQQNQEYMKMTKNVDAALKNYPEDTIAYQMKTLNKQIIAVFQFVLSVVAGFAFGFLGLEWIIGGLDFGLRLLLGIMIALVIALAEIYFLAKKLNEYDDVTATANTYQHKFSPSKSKKPHSD